MIYLIHADNCGHQQIFFRGHFLSVLNVENAQYNTDSKLEFIKEKRKENKTMTSCQGTHTNVDIDLLLLVTDKYLRVYGSMSQYCTC